MKFSNATPQRRLRPFLLAICLPVVAATPLHAQEAAPEAEKEAAPAMRILCVGSLSGDEEEIVLASKTEEGEWKEITVFKLRSSFVTDWMKTASGELHLAKRGAEGLVPIGSFRLKEGTRRSIVILLPDKEKMTYRADVIDPKELGFRKGAVLVVNYSRIPAVVMLGTKRTDVKPGERVAARAVANEDGMYRMLAGYKNESDEIVACYDRYVPDNPDSRDFLMLFPDPVGGLRVYSLPEFGPFE